MLNFKFHKKHFVEVAQYLTDNIGEPQEERTWFWNYEHGSSIMTDRVTIWNVTPEATIAALKWGI